MTSPIMQAASTRTGYPYWSIIGLKRDDGSLIDGAYFHREHGTIPDTDEQTSNEYVWSLLLGGFSAYCGYTAQRKPRLCALR